MPRLALTPGTIVFDSAWQPSLYSERCADSPAPVGTAPCKSFTLVFGDLHRRRRDAVHRLLTRWGSGDASAGEPIMDHDAERLALAGADTARRGRPGAAADPDTRKAPSLERLNLTCQ